MKFNNFLTLIIFGIFVNNVTSDNSGCPNRVFLGCVLRLKAQRVPFEKNILNVIFNIGTEARLMHTCKAYSEIMPCFRDKILECGNDKQKRMLNEVGKTLMFLCSPFSMERQKLLMKHQKCIGEILSLPATVGCKMHDHYHGKQLLKCREVCQEKPTDFTCMLKTWISEQNVCTLRDIHDKCGYEASSFYTELQSTVFEPLFPILCDHPVDYTTVIQPTPPTIPVITTLLPEITTYPQSSSRTVISLPPPYPHNRMIQPPRIRQTNRNIKHKPVDEKPLPFWSASPNMYSPPSPSLQHHQYMGPQIYHRYPVTISAEPLTTTTEEPASPEESQYPFISLFKKILPKSFPEKFKSLFKGDEIQPTSKYELSSQLPIPAKEIFELNTDPTPDPYIDTTVTIIPAISTTESENINIKEELITTTIPLIKDLTPPLPNTNKNSLIPATFELSPKSIPGQIKKLDKWKPWYLGGFNQNQSEEKFKIPLYHGA